MNVQSLPIGVFDSGLGGLSVAAEIQAMLPHARLLYLADSRFCPYGDRPLEEIRWRSNLIAATLIDRGAKLLVIACNTATAAALEELRSRFQVPIIGLEPALKPAVALSASRQIGVLATAGTAASGRLRRLIERYGTGVTVHVVAAPGLVELVEAGLTTGEAVERALRPLIQPLLDKGVDTIVLGCTHYPFLRRSIQAMTGDNVTLVDSGAAIARRTRDLLTIAGMATGDVGTGSIEILTTGDVDRVSGIARRLLDVSVHASSLELPVSVSESPGYGAALAPKCSAEWTVSTSAGA